MLRQSDIFNTETLDIFLKTDFPKDHKPPESKLTIIKPDSWLSHFTFYGRDFTYTNHLDWQGELDVPPEIEFKKGLFKLGLG